MRNQNISSYGKIKKSRFPASLFSIFLVILLLMSGIHTGIIVFMDVLHWNDVLQSIIPIGYWSLVAVGLTLFTRKKMKDTYEEPIHKLAEATRKVANGDFSIYVPTLHTRDKLDYLDVMILDFNKMVEELGSIETLKTDFVSNVSHEMKTPIAVIKNSAQLLQMRMVSEKQRIEYAKTIENAAGRLSDLITNILKLNKLENQKISPKTETYDVCRQICDCVIQFENKWEEKELELEMDLEDTAMIQADKQLMELVWNNLLSNAIKFTGLGGTIKIQQRSDEDYIRVSVSDTGCGMSQEIKKHIFDKFYQGDTSHSIEGNGLGLALVHRVIQLLDGEIQVVSELGKGSTFTVILPISKEFDQQMEGNDEVYGK